jgi:hypothetical protein
MDEDEEEEQRTPINNTRHQKKITTSKRIFNPRILQEENEQNESEENRESEKGEEDVGSTKYVRQIKLDRRGIEEDEEIDASDDNDNEKEEIRGRKTIFRKRLFSPFPPPSATQKRTFLHITEDDSPTSPTPRNSPNLLNSNSPVSRNSPNLPKARISNSKFPRTLFRKVRDETAEEEENSMERNDKPKSLRSRMVQEMEDSDEDRRGEETEQNVAETQDKRTHNSKNSTRRVSEDVEN